MRALSLWQPWASAIAKGAKTLETRPRPTKIRGEVVIQAALKWDRGLVRITNDLATQLPSQLAFMRPWADGSARPPLGQALCVVNLVGCYPTTDAFRATVAKAGSAERLLGDYAPGRFVYVLRDVRVLTRHVPLKGRQGFWNLSADEEAAVRSALPPRTFDLAPGNPSVPRYFHRLTGMVEEIHGWTIRHRDAAKRRLVKRVERQGFNPDEIEYRAGLGPGMFPR